jgi:hypothetical protein
MAKSDDISSIADAGRPNAGRIYDYLLGGKHNFEIDRQAAEKILQISPFATKFVRLIRWFLGEATRRLVEEGFSHFLDFASGLPTKDHIHEVAPPDAKVIYSDIDPITVEYAKEILKDKPNTRFRSSLATRKRSPWVSTGSPIFSRTSRWLIFPVSSTNGQAKAPSSL